MHVFGLTGGIGTGKSTVARLLAAKGAVVIDADRIAREVVAPDSPALQEIVKEFGESVLNARGELDRAKLAAIVFSDPEKRRRLEAITHPRIFARFAQEITQAAEKGARVVILDVPLLFETGGLASAVEKVIVVYAPVQTQVERLAQRDGMTEEQARARIGAQMDIEEKRKRGDYVIENTGSLEDLARAVDRLWPLLTDSPAQDTA